MKQSHQYSSEQVKVRPMTISDVDRIVLMEAESFSDPWPKQAFTDELGRRDGGVIIAEIDGIITGYAAYIVCFGEAHLTNIAVTYRYRGKSIAKILLNSIFEIANKADCEYIFLDVRPSNSAAIALYREFGFQELYQRPNYYRMPPEDAIVMVKNLKGDIDTNGLV